MASAFAAESAPKAFTAIQKRWWAIQPVREQTPPVATLSRIDAFVHAKLQGKGITPNPSADPVTLLRRATLDLTGLPPTPEETQAFLSDRSPEAFAKVVDRLLASPRYGERWGRHWLDLARYADSEGFKADETRPNIWRYRDYVIQSFNEDKPYNRFVQEQLAGDEMFPGDAQALVATGFNRHFPDEYNARNLYQRRQELLNDITDVVGSTFMGLTFGCARCHDHKFDPILHKDYYRLQSFFAGLHIDDQATLASPKAQQEYQAQLKVWEKATFDVRKEIASVLKIQRDFRVKENFDKFPEEIQASVTCAPEKRTPMQWQMYYKAMPQLTFDDAEVAKGIRGDVKAAYQKLAAKLKTFDHLKPAELPITQAMVEDVAAIPSTHVLRGGAYDAVDEEVQPGFLSILDPSDLRLPAAPAGKSGRRTALAKWLTDPANPLTARVIVNRVWHYHFGQGLVATPSDFGLMGARPTHKELLDDLSYRFVRDGWSIKRLHREIMLSETYRRSSDFAAAAGQADPENATLWRYNRRRLEGESIRDSMLAVSGLLNTKMNGPGVFPPLPAGVETRGGWKRDESLEEARRRSIYIFVRRNTRYPMFEAFDMPDTHESCARRNQTVTPSQALELMNSEMVLDWSKGLAARVLNDAGLSREAMVDRAYRLVYARPASDDEKRLASDFFTRHQPILAARSAPLVVPDKLPSGIQPIEAAVLVDLCHALFNSNEFLYIN
ncbi:MAG: DUF1549 and DUF1553 domain-containing protein [Bryobacteraceae bacterium]|nr:DUF1549 and DUF1553 domain-containing protein [Bryobacteraceae bacterium]